MASMPVSKLGQSMLILAVQLLQYKREIDSKVCLPNGEPLPVVLLANNVSLSEGAGRGWGG